MPDRRGASEAGGGPGDEFLRPDLEGVRSTTEDVGSLPVPKSIRDQRRGTPLRRALRRAKPPAEPRPLTGREGEARLRSTLPKAALTPEQLGRALSRGGQSGLPDPQAGREAGPPLPGEPGYRGDP